MIAARPKTRRLHPRLVAPVPVEISSPCGKTAVNLFDLSLGGAKVRLPWALSPGERIEIILLDPLEGAGQEGTCRAEGRVVHRDGPIGRYVFGIEFWSTEEPMRFERIVRRWFRIYGQSAYGTDRMAA